MGATLAAPTAGAGAWAGVGVAAAAGITDVASSEDGEQGRGGAATGEPQDSLCDGVRTIGPSVKIGQPDEGPGHDWYGVVRWGPVGSPDPTGRPSSVGLERSQQERRHLLAGDRGEGQYRPSPQPPVRPASAVALIADSSELLLSSVK